MKKIVLILFILFSFCLISCNKEQESEVKEYNVTFKNALDNVVLEYKLKEGESIVYPDNEKMEVDGYRFLETYDNDIQTITSDIIIKGNYVKVWTVNFYNEFNELISTQKIDNGCSAVSPELSPIDGYIFKNWKDDFNNVTSDLDIYGEYDVITYNLKYESNVSDSILCSVNSNTSVLYNSLVRVEAKDMLGYTFLGFYENDILLTIDKTYTFNIDRDYNIICKYAKIDLEIVNENGNKFIYFGKYPQTLLEDNSIISILNQIETDEYGYITYSNVTYLKATANTHDKKAYKSLSGKTEIKNGQDYYFIVEEIKWRVIDTGNNTYELLSEYTLDNGAFFGGVDGDLGVREIDGQKVFANNYMYSDVRKYLNETFYNLSFANIEKEIIMTTHVDNSYKTGLDFNSDMDPTAYACTDTYDKVYLISYKDYQKKAINKQSRVTDYAIANGCWFQTSSSYKYNSFWWFRTPNPAYQDITWFDMCALISDDEGGFDWNLFVVYNYVGYRPAITILK